LNAEREEDRRRAQDQDLMTLQWYRPTNTLSLVPHRYREAKLSEIDLSLPQSAWALRGAWVGWKNEGRVVGASSKAALYVPEGSSRLQLEWAGGSAASVKVLAGGRLLGYAKGQGKESLDLPAGTRGELEVELQSEAKPMLRWIRVTP
jgi:hypothetical protein